MKIIRYPKHGENISNAERTASLIGGGLVIVESLRRRGPSGVLTALLGAEMVRRGFTGRCYVYHLLGISTAGGYQGPNVSLPYPLGIRVDCSETVNRPPDEVYRFWRNLENLPRFMRHLKSVSVIDSSRSHWVAKAPAGRTVEWDAEIINEIENELIGWRSLPDSQIPNAGSVHFRPAPGGRGTVVQVELQYNPPAGILGAVVAQMLGEEPTQQIRDDLHRFKQVIEAGEIPTTNGQSVGRVESENVNA